MTVQGNQGRCWCCDQTLRGVSYDGCCEECYVEGLKQVAMDSEADGTPLDELPNDVRQFRTDQPEG